MSVNGNIFNVDYSRLARWLMPKPLRQVKLMAFVTALISGVKNTYISFSGYRDNTNYWLGITPQVCFMEKALNDRYDRTERRIIVEDAEERLGFPVFLKEENKPVVFYSKTEDVPVVMYTKNETAQFSSDFVVKVPVFIDFDVTEMTAFVQQIKLAGRTFKIMIV